MATDPTSAFRGALEIALKADEPHLARFHYLLGVIRNLLVATPDNRMLWAQVQALEDIITTYEAKDALLREVLKNLNVQTRGG